MSRFALLLGLAGRAHAAPEPGLDDGLGWSIALPTVEPRALVTRNTLGLAGPIGVRCP